MVGGRTTGPWRSFAMSKRLPGVSGFALGLLMLLTGSPFAWGQGKAKPHVAIPAAAEVSKITFQADKRFPGGPFELSLTRPEEVAPLLTWLRDVGWDYAKSGDTKVIRFAPLASIKLSRKDKPDLC